MRKTLIPAAAATLALLAATSGRAADYEPPMVIDEAPLYVPVEVGSAWYLRGDLTYYLDDPAYDFDGLGGDAKNNRFGGSIGIGYHFNDLLRADFNLSYISDDEFLFDDGVDYLSAENRVLGAMVHGYLDLGTFVGFTPYVGIGAGMLFSKQEVHVDTAMFTLDATDRQSEFAYAVNAGVNYQVTRNLSLDLGYQYLSSPGTEYINLDSGTVEDGVDYHQIKVGLRYDLW